MGRNTLHLAALGLGGAALAALARGPRDRGAPHAPYFAALQAQLAKNGPGKPVVVLDLDALDANLDEVQATVSAGLAVRLVAKSLPSLPLLRYLEARSGYRRLMVFDGSLATIAAAFPSSDILTGKPLPARLVEDFYRAHVRTVAIPRPGGAGSRVQWLVDDLDRLDAYAAIARSHGVILRVSLEIDVGLHRGGFATPAALSSALRRISELPGQLSFAGLMGYDPHVAAAPTLLRLRERSFQAAVTRYAAFVDRVRAHDASWLEAAIFNGAGSKTFSRHRSEGPVNEVAVGSALVFPSDFDVRSLRRHRPAVFIATPVLKALEGTSIPLLERVSSLWPRWDPNRERSYFVFGGGWLAKPVSPAGLAPNRFYGFSTNQALLNGSERTALRVDDWVFLRPTQSERVMQQFGAIHLVRDGRLDGTWEVLPSA